MDNLFSRITLTDVHQGLFRNIVSLRESEDLFDDLSGNPDEWAVAQTAETDARPRPYASFIPEIHRPFEEAVWFNAIAWPFRNWCVSRFSDGSFGVWYGSDRIETTVRETAYHWYHRLLIDAGFDKEGVVVERRVFCVQCDAALLDIRTLAETHPLVIHRTDYSFTQSIGSRVHREGHPGLVSRSVRHETGSVFAVLNPNVLSNPGHHSYLTYILEGDRIAVEKKPGAKWLEIAL